MFNLEDYRHPDETGPEPYTSYPMTPVERLEFHAKLADRAQRERLFASYHRKVLQIRAVKAANKKTTVRPGLWMLVIKTVLILFVLTVILAKCTDAVGQNRSFCRESRYPGKRIDYRFTSKKHSVAHFRKKENRKRIQRMKRNQFLKSFKPFKAQ